MAGLLLETRRGGWAFAKIGPAKDSVLAIFYGVCSEPWLTVVRTELRAIEEALRRALAPLTIYTDNAAVVNAFQEGKAYSCREGNDGADIWTRIWAILEDFGECQVLKVKAHTTAEDASEGLIDPYKQAGNAAADFFAVQARRAAAAEAPTRAFEQHYARARDWYKHIIAGIGGWKEDAQADAEQHREEVSAQLEPPSTPLQRAPGTRRHSVWLMGNAVCCRTCGLSFGEGTRPNTVARQRCRGPPAARVLLSLGLRLDPQDEHAYTVAEMQSAGAIPWRAAEAPQGTVVVAPEPPRRRLRGKQPLPAMEATVRTSVPRKEVESKHLLVKRGRATYCERCGRWAIDRISKGLLRMCTGTTETKHGSYRVRRERLRAGRHPLTGVMLS